MQKHSQSLSDMSLNATVVGAGFSGLTMAYYLLKNNYKVTVFEKSDHVAGLLRSPKTPYGVIEHAANGLINSKQLIDLCSDIGVDLLYPGQSSKKKYLVRDGKITRWPFGFFETIKVIIQIFKFKKNKSTLKPKQKESFALWTERVFSNKLLDRLVEPAFQGVYASFAKNLSANLVTKNLFKESDKTKNAGIKRQTVCFKGGMEELCIKLSEYLISNGVKVELNTEASDLNSEDLNILTCSSAAASKIVGKHHQTLASELSNLKTISIAKVACFIKKEEHDPEGFGCLFPRSEGFNSLGVLFDSAVFPSRYTDHSLHTWILGDQLLAKCNSDDDISALVKADIKKLWNKELKIEHIDIKVWKNTLPLYDTELEGFLAKYNLDEEIADKLYLFGNYTGSLGLSQILEKAKDIATRINYEQTK